MKRFNWVLLLGLMVAGCDRLGPKKTTATPVPPSTPVDEGRALFDQGQLDAALAKLREMPNDPDSLAYQAAIWAKKAETAPLPTPPAAPSPLPRGAQPPPAPEFKAEELTAIDLFEKAIGARADNPKAHFGLAELLASHAARRYDAEEAQKKAHPPRRGKETPTPAPLAEAGPDVSPDRVLNEYRAAWQAEAEGTAPVESYIRFAERTGRLDAAEIGLQELTRREPEKSEPFVRYGDFLAKEKKDPLAAVEQYKQALVWRVEDDATRARIADIYITMGVEHWKAAQYALAESRFREAQKFITDKNTPQAQTVREYLGKLGEIRHR